MAAATLVIITFASLGAIFIVERHLRVDLILSHIPYKWRQMIEAFQGILVLGLTIVFTLLWFKMSYGIYKAESRFAISHLPVWPIQIFVMLGWLALIIGEIYFTVNKIKLFLSSSGKK